MKNKPILLRVLELESEELTVLFKMAVRLLYSDGIAGIEEWNLLTLIPALLDVVKEDTPDGIKEIWMKKIELVQAAIEEQSDMTQDEKDVLLSIENPAKRDICLLMLFMIASCDRSVDKAELDIIVKDVARPWKYSVDSLVSLVNGAADEIKRPSEIVTLLDSYK
ncbi:MAG: hypothetical protein JW881_04705 [Spirochaetales bacterium]|nr:hypothetical protein [Spirochaetales bacterium]